MARKWKRKRPLVLRKPALTIPRILAWADAHHARTGRWPRRTGGRVREELFESWAAVNAALDKGVCGLPGGDSLARLLDRERGVRNRKALPRLTESRIVSRAKEHRRLTGKWPTESAGQIGGTRGEVWNNVAAALAQGIRGLPGGDTLARLLARRLGVRNGAALPPLSVEGILVWADAYHALNGRWPKAKSGRIGAAIAETWAGVDSALCSGVRGLPGGSSLARLLAEHRGVRNIRDLPKLTVSRVLEWADAHRERTGRWPGQLAGPIPEAPGETWAAVSLALRRDTRGLPGGKSLQHLLMRRRSKVK